MPLDYKIEEEKSHTAPKTITEEERLTILVAKTKHEPRLHAFANLPKIRTSSCSASPK